MGPKLGGHSNQFLACTLSLTRTVGKQTPTNPKTHQQITAQTIRNSFSENMTLNTSLSWADYLVVAVCLTISAGIGVWFRFAGGRQSSTEEFLMGNRQMSVFPVALSLLSSFISAVTIMGNSVWLRGTAILQPQFFFAKM